MNTGDVSKKLNIINLEVKEAPPKVKVKSLKPIEGGLIAQVKIGEKEYTVNIGYNKKALQEKYKFDQNNTLEMTIQKILEEIKPAAYFELVGKTIRTNLEKPAETKVKLQDRKFTPLNELDKSDHSELLKTIKHVIDVFKKHFEFAGSSPKIDEIVKSTDTQNTVKKIQKTVETNKPIRRPDKQIPLLEVDKVVENFEKFHKQKLIAEKGKKIDYDYKDGETKLGKEVIKRVSVVTNVIKSNDDKIKYLEKRKIEIDNELKKMSEDDEGYEKKMNQIPKLDFEIVRCMKNIENANVLLKKQDWLDSSYTRKTLRDAESFGEAVDKFVMAPINFRKQSLYVDDKEVGRFLRCGVIYDPRNGLTNLKELKEMKNEIEKCGSYHLIEDKLEKLNDHIQYLEKEKAPKKTQDAFEYARKRLNNVFSQEILDHKVMIQELDKLIEYRHKVLQDQFVHLVAEHVKQNKESINELKEGETFNFIHVALLNRKKGKKDGKLNVKKGSFGWSSVGKNGWAHVEENNMLDMCELINEAKDTTLIFDGKGPFVDDEGKYHMPIVLNNDKLRTLKLNPIFMNNTVQGHTKNDGVQKEINKQGIKELKQVLKSKSNNLINSIETNKQKLTKAEDQPKTNNVDKLKDQIRTDEAKLKKFEEVYKEALENFKNFKQMLGRKSDYFSARALTAAIMKAGIALSISCQSTKDRGGVVSADTILDVLEPYLKDKIPNAKRRKYVWEDMQARIFDDDRPLAKVIYDNTGIKVAKIPWTTWSIPGFSGKEEGIRGKLRRARQMIKGAGAKVSEGIKA